MLGARKPLLSITKLLLVLKRTYKVNTTIKYRAIGIASSAMIAMQACWLRHAPSDCVQRNLQTVIFSSTAI